MAHVPAIRGGGGGGGTGGGGGGGAAIPEYKAEVGLCKFCAWAFHIVYNIML